MRQRETERERGETKGGERKGDRERKGGRERETERQREGRERETERQREGREGEGGDKTESENESSGQTKPYLVSGTPVDNGHPPSSFSICWSPYR